MLNRTFQSKPVERAGPSPALFTSLINRVRIRLSQKLSWTPSEPMQLLKMSVDFWDSIDYDGLRWTCDSFRRSHLKVNRIKGLRDLVKLEIQSNRFFDERE